MEDSALSSGPTTIVTGAPLSLEVPGSSSAAGASQTFSWTPAKLVLSLFLFVAAAAAEVGGGWLIWQAIRESRPWWWGLTGSVVLVLYGFVPTLQPISNFGRTFAVYGGFFIVYSYGWGWALDKQQPDTGLVPCPACCSWYCP